MQVWKDLKDKIAWGKKSGFMMTKRYILSYGMKFMQIFTCMIDDAKGENYVVNSGQECDNTSNSWGGIVHDVGFTRIHPILFVEKRITTRINHLD